MVSSALSKTKIALHSIYIKIFVNYLQIIGVMLSFKLNWPAMVNDFLTAQEVAGSATGQLFSMNCFMQEMFTLNVFFQLLILFAVLPPIILVVCSLFWTTKSLIKKNWSYMKYELVASIIVVMFLFHPNISRYMMSAFACTEIDANEYWLVADLDIRCWNSEHSFFALCVALPGLVLWGIGAPAVALVVILKKPNELSDISQKSRFDFLVKGYKPQLFFWEFIIIYRKISIVLISVFLSTVGDAV